MDGSALTSEAVLAHLPGYAGSRPVRVGNAAEHQVQLDVFGPVAELLRDIVTARGAIDDRRHARRVCRTTGIQVGVRIDQGGERFRGGGLLPSAWTLLTHRNTIS